MHPLPEKKNVNREDAKDAKKHTLKGLLTAAFCWCGNRNPDLMSENKQVRFHPLIRVLL